MNTHKYYVYVYKDPFTLNPFYVGKGSGSRYKDHLVGDNSSKRVQDKIGSIDKKGKKPIVELVFFSEIENEAYDKEKELIITYGRKGIDPNGILMNICPDSRPPNYKNKEMIRQCYLSDEEVSLDQNLLNEVRIFLQDCTSKKRFNNLLKTQIGIKFITATKHFPIEYNIAQRLYDIEHGSFDHLCENCSKAVSFKCFGKSYGYARFCSTKCKNESIWGREAQSHRIVRQETKDKIAASVKRSYIDGSKKNNFETNNPMLTTEGIKKWKQSRNSKL